MQNNALSQDEELEFINLLSSQEGSHFTVHVDFGSIFWFTDCNDAELRISFHGLRITVSRACFNKKRQGTMTKIFEILKKIARKQGFEQIVIQCVLTTAMEKWCFKNGFVPDEHASFITKDGIRGDFIYQLDLTEEGGIHLVGPEQKKSQGNYRTKE